MTRFQRKIHPLLWVCVFVLGAAMIALAAMHSGGTP